jgi:TonB-linked SusC/RagA family outer membrane protein
MLKGQITDETGETLVGASIVLKGTGRNVFSDMDGFFTLENVEINSLIEISYIGYHPQEVVFNGQETVHIVLVEAANTVTGTVRDASTGKPVAGANIDVAGIASAISEDDGSYTIHLPAKNGILAVSGYGYARRDIPVQGRDRIDIVLYDGAYKGAQRDVYTPTGDRSSTQVANAWEVVKENNDLSIAVTPDVLMQGYAGGVNSIFRSGMPGYGANMYLHGFNTLNAGNMPLFVVDGLPYENTIYATSLIGNYQANPLASIDIKDIESLTVMKDGTSLFGVKGANGVVLIKTLKSKQLETKINVHVHTGVNFEPDRYPLLTAAGHRSLLSEIIQGQLSDPQQVAGLPFFNREIPVQYPWGYEGNTDYYRYNHETNWQNQIYNAKYNQDYYLNVSGGDDIAVYMLSLGYLNQSGILKNTHFQRFNARFNSEIKLTKNLHFLANMSFTYGDKSPANEGADKRINPIFAALVKSPFTATHIYNETGQQSPNVETADVFGNSNPYVLSENTSLVNVNYRFMGSFELKWQFNEALSLNNFVGVNFNKEREKIFYPSTGIAFEPVNDTPVVNKSQHRVDYLFSLYNDTYLDYRQQFSGNHSLGGRIGVRYQNNKAENDYGIAYNSSSDDFKSIQYGEALLRQIGGTIGSWNWLSAYVHVDYSLMNKYFFNISASSDATSRSGADAQFLYIYPSVAGAWLVSGENFMQGAAWLNLLKLRLSYGLSGNDDMGNYSARRYYQTQNLLGAYGIVRGNLVNTGLKPETVERINAGIDGAVWNERLNVSVDLYRNTTKDMILVSTPEYVTGFSSYLSNAGSMQNTGIDLTVNTRILNRAFKWDLGVVVSKYKNEVLNLNGESYLTDILGASVQTKTGQPIGLFYGYQTDGVYATQAEADAGGLHILQGLVEVPFRAGDVRFVNQNNDSRIDENDRVVIGDPNPDFFGSVSNTFQYRQWSLNTLMVYSLGNDVYNYTRSQMENMSTYNNQSKAVLNRWRTEGDVTDIPKAVYGDPMGNSRFSDRWIEDGSYIRLKQVTLACDLNIKYKMLQRCTVFVTGENLLTLTRYKGLDPEFALGQNPLYYGIDACVVPQPRTVSIGIKLEL